MTNQGACPTSSPEKNWHCKGIRLFVAGLCCLLPWQSVANDDWWFEIELIVFKRTIDPMSVDERFESTLEVARTAQQFDLLTPYLRPDLTLLTEGLPLCYEKAPRDVAFPYQDYALYPQLMDKSVDFDTLADDQSWQTSHHELPLEYAYESSLSEAENGQDRGYQQVENKHSPDTLQKAFSFDVENTDNAPDSDRGNDPMDNFDIDLPSVNFSLPASLACQFEGERFYLASPLDEPQSLPIIESVPAKPNGTEWLYSPSPYLIPANSLQLTKLARDIARQRGVDGLLHLGWRQNVLFGQNKAPAMRLFAGNNFATEYDINGHIIKEVKEGQSYIGDIDLVLDHSEDLISKIRDALANPDFQTEEQGLTEIEKLDNSDLATETTDQLWELDGYFKVFLRYIKRTPYLHIDSELDYRAPVFSQLNGTDALMNQNEVDAVQVIPDEIKSFKFKQLRRVISKQIHYFDHPLFGMVVQIRRHHKPQKTDLVENVAQTGDL